MKNQRTLLAIIYFAVLAVTIIIACTLFMQYRFFKQEAQQLMEVKEAYYQHVEMLKRSLNASMVQDDQEEEEVEGEKKKIINSLISQVVLDLESVPDQDDSVSRQLSTENNDAPDFQIISREEDRQLRSIKSGLKKTKLAPALKRKRSPKKVFYKIPKISARYGPHRDFDFSWPLELSSFWLSSLFGPRKRPNGHVEFHQGIDMAAMKGTPVKAAAAGKIVLAQTVPGYGNCVMIEHNGRYKTRYGHLHRILVRQGQEVVQGQVVATVGDTGLVRKSGRDASHLHFEIYQQGVRVNPLIFLFT